MPCSARNKSGMGVGTYGALPVNADGSYSYAVNAALLMALQPASSPLFPYTTLFRSALGLTDTRTVAINVVGANDTPVATGTYTHTVTDTAALNTFGALTGTLAASDRDTRRLLTRRGSGAGSDGTLTENADGSYSYAVNAAAVNALQAGSTPSDSFTVAVPDARRSFPTRRSSDLVVGANDTPVATGTYTHTVTDTAALNTFGALTGTLAA